MAAAPPAARATRATRSAWHFPGSYWFVLAALYGALVLPWSVLGQIGLLPAPAALHTGLGHAHEMLFGFALAVVAGYTLKPGTLGRSALLLLAWALARLAFLLAPASRVAFGLNGLFVTGLALLVAPTYLRASKWSNRSVALILTGLALAALAFHLASKVQGMHTAGLAAVLLLSMLMFFMGGRILAPAVAGHVRTKRAPLAHVVQPTLELTQLCVLGASILLVASGLPWAHRMAGGLLLAAVVLALVRIVRWHFWLCHDKPDLLALLAGYLWLITGWLLTGAALLAQRPATTALHAITAGALGTLTYTVMLRTRMFRVTGNTLHLRWAYLGALLLGLAALLRIAAQGRAPLVGASVLWSLTYLLLAGVLLWLRGARAQAAKGS
ncbi:NnrS family protein [Comamonas sp. NLF-1-9]|uniref:NnrS family protein n=1 Tax=Comamonas sp. NLF-1-9 TaxID=2853163 RepID=UPI001C446E67|nr:NnrS family protein [Comamonas sp. NLF-1-9]QXL83916.1 NnrS family protein [Comamonas sp. NLF-1-9]